MLKKSVADYIYETGDDGSKIYALEIKGSKGDALSVSELRD